MNLIVKMDDILSRLMKAIAEQEEDMIRNSLEIVGFSLEDIRKDPSRVTINRRSSTAQSTFDSISDILIDGKYQFTIVRTVRWVEDESGVPHFVLNARMIR